MAMAACRRGVIARDQRVVLRPAHIFREVQQHGDSKATAVRALMGRSPFAGRVPMFVGDDMTDEAGMDVAREFGGEGWRLQEVLGRRGVAGGMAGRSAEI